MQKEVHLQNPTWWESKSSTWIWPRQYLYSISGYSAVLRNKKSFFIFGMIQTKSTSIRLIIISLSIIPYSSLWPPRNCRNSETAFKCCLFSTQQGTIWTSKILHKYHVTLKCLYLSVYFTIWFAIKLSIHFHLHISIHFSIYLSIHFLLSIIFLFIYFYLFFIQIYLVHTHIL